MLNLFSLPVSSMTYTPSERRAVAALSGIFSLRMVGLFMILPVFSIYGRALPGATPFLIGLAVGAYGLAQLLLQIPFGLLADRHDRRRLILFGLLLFVIGGLVASAATNIWMVIAGRFLQGSGAISAVVMALLADLVREEQRTKSMAFVGMSIGVSFAVAFMLGPWLAGHVGLSGLFMVTVVMGLLAMLVCQVLVPNAQLVQRQLPSHYGTLLYQMLRQPELLRLNIGIFALHMVLTACFVALPPLLVAAGLPASRHGLLYLPVMVLAFIALVPAVIVAEKRRRMREVFLAAIALLGIAMVLLAELHAALAGLVSAVALFFFAFNLLEALLPSLVSKMAPAGGKGTAMGIYSTSQFLGAFLGGMLGGWLQARHDPQQLFLVLASVVLFWWLVAYGMRQPAYWLSVTVRLPEPEVSETLIHRLRDLPGVEEMSVVAEDALVYLKVDRQRWQPERLQDSGLTVWTG